MRAPAKREPRIARLDGLDWTGSTRRARLDGASEHRNEEERA